MSQTIGEKLRQAREERGISISEVAEQTRISALYLESIENDNYKPLPGGIFNKGFVKSYAKFIGIDEQEALTDYARQISENEASSEQPLKVYRPEVLTDDNASSSMLPTILFAGIILALMTGGILFVLNYLQNREPGNVANTNTNINPNASNVANSIVNPTPVSGAPTMATVKVEFRAANDAISLNAVNDGKSSTSTVTAGSSISFEPKESLKLSYSRSLAQSARLLINGKTILLPEVPENPKRNVIEFEINQTTLPKYWDEGKVSFGVAVATTPTTQPTVTTPVNTTPNINAANTPVVNRPPSTPRPTPRPTNANRPPANKPPPTMQPTIIPRPTTN